MPTDTQIPVSQVVPAPADYPVPSTVELRLKAVRAEFTDNSAASDWLPTVELISDSGHVILTASSQAVKVTAGSDADVSWFRGAGLGGAASTDPNVGAVCFAEGNIDAGGTLPVYFDFKTSDAAMYALNVANTEVVFLQTGSYLIYTYVDLSSNTATATDGLNVTVTLTGAGSHDARPISGTWEQTSSPSGGGGLRDWIPNQTLLATVNTIPNPANPPRIDVAAFQFPANLETGMDTVVSVVRLGAPLGGNL